MYRPSPFKKSTLYAWMREARAAHANQVLHNTEHDLDIHVLTADMVMKYIHKHHPGVLFSPNWFKSQFRKFSDVSDVSMHAQLGTPA
jgi:hypothetical protein